MRCCRVVIFDDSYGDDRGVRIFRLDRSGKGVRFGGNEDWWGERVRGLGYLWGEVV
jgi:hypothetical protein